MKKDRSFSLVPSSRRKPDVDPNLSSSFLNIGYLHSHLHHHSLVSTCNSQNDHMVAPNTSEGSCCCSHLIKEKLNRKGFIKVQNQLFGCIFFSCQCEEQLVFVQINKEEKETQCFSPTPRRHPLLSCSFPDISSLSALVEHRSGPLSAFSLSHTTIHWWQCTLFWVQTEPVASVYMFLSHTSIS